MITLLLYTALTANEGSPSHSVHKTITFTGTVPIATCQIDQFSDEKLERLYKPLTCPDKKQVIIKKKLIALDGNMMDTWVIEYDDAK
ncbi:hypothetical protein [Aeromonas salmonicida]|uniref:hypothetical protein n=1 Tax=Aeromonas salmonicida TaxID=645 RepID=UPI00223F39BE|nr:hypothetical protein [Aeromonas salmonicida]